MTVIEYIFSVIFSPLIFTLRNMVTWIFHLLFCFFSRIIAELSSCCIFTICYRLLAQEELCIFFIFDGVFLVFDGPSSYLIEFLHCGGKPPHPQLKIHPSGMAMDSKVVYVVRPWPSGPRGLPGMALHYDTPCLRSAGPFILFLIL